MSTGIGLELERGPIFESNLQEITYPVRSDGIFLFYSDGLTEAMDPDKKQFGEDSICALVQTHRKNSAQEIQTSLLSAVEKFQGKADQHDDITIVVAKYR